MKYSNRLTENEWLEILKNAIDDGVEIQVNHRFKYKDKNLGTFLTSAKRKNKIELINKIEKLGVDFQKHSKDPENYLKKFTAQLSADKTPIKQRYITRFNTYVIPKKNIFKKKDIQNLNKVWKAKFGDIRKWEKPETTADKILQWKNFRYDKEKNPDGKWFDFKTRMGKLYSWVYVRKTNKQKMKLLVEHFNKKELSELKREGF